LAVPVQSYKCHKRNKVLRGEQCNPHLERLLGGPEERTWEHFLEEVIYKLKPEGWEDLASGEGR